MINSIYFGGIKYKRDYFGQTGTIKEDAFYYGVANTGGGVDIRTMTGGSSAVNNFSIIGTANYKNHNCYVGIVLLDGYNGSNILLVPMNHADIKNGGVNRPPLTHLYQAFKAFITRLVVIA
ncbi:hypothetical protein [Lactobacillus intestinalis]|uniref:hypothetical protein n=2 Tax=Lactobacillus intestinalis TaxID=151781 RepID=UPI0002CC38CF|nr:hypothetical protein [Lactobacillus intestinalis]KAI4308828.1 hypothetical protein C821_000496 [Lactobacillus intestinalis]